MSNVTDIFTDKLNIDSHVAISNIIETYFPLPPHPFPPFSLKQGNLPHLSQVGCFNNWTVMMEVLSRILLWS